MTSKKDGNSHKANKILSCLGATELIEQRNLKLNGWQRVREFCIPLTQRGKSKQTISF